ncbi:transcription factor HES-2 [Suncus etruscus]|uniref:transcription factor HES-2 n=1 Tax=Suncus etruscus TaxID=109475 RepID=UPI00210FBAC5|nr:transcription factor HES-2 [Suncus etruscus]
MGLPRRVGDQAERRQSQKPQLERRRRARINASLGQLGGLLLPLLGRRDSGHRKLEKAEILEMTVRFLRGLPVSPTSPEPESEATDNYDQGYRACLARLARLLPACPVLDPAARACLLEHLRWRAARAIPDGVRAVGKPCHAPVPYPPQLASVPPQPPLQPSFWRPW